MHRRTFVRGLASAVLVGRAVVFIRAEDAAATDLVALLEGLRKAQGLPGVAAAAVRGDRVVAEGIAGVRRVGQSEAIAVGDRFSLASCTKPMTALMVCRLIDAGRLTFDTTLAEALPDVPMRAVYRPVTVAQLLTHRGGIPQYTQVRVDGGWTGALRDLNGTAAEQRSEFVRRLLQEEPAAEPGTTRNYSNAGYALAAFVASQRTGRSWETLMESEVFRPLDMARAGFGRPRVAGRPDEPARHLKQEAAYVPEPEPEREGDELAALAAAGGVHCTIGDFARFASYELATIEGKDPLLTAATARRWQELTQPPAAAAAGRPRQIFGGAPAISAACALWPGENAAVVVAVNGGGANLQAIIAAVKERCLVAAG